MNDEQINQLKPGLILPATISIYAANRDKMTIEEAIVEARTLIDAIDLKTIISKIGVRI